MQKKKFLITLLIACSLATLMPTRPVKAYLNFDPTNLGQAIVDYVAKIPGVVAEVGDFALTQAKDALLGRSAFSVVLAKIIALEGEQLLVSAIIGDGAEGTIIRDFNNYLYVSPQQRAMAQMNSFFNTVSRGRLSTLNYEGVGPNYDAYLVSQARMAIAGQSFTTNLQDIVTDPTQMFDGGNMKGLMTYMQCANNVACYTLTSTARYNQEFSKAQEIAKNENVSGFIPKKVNGRITQPASIAQNALLQIDQLGTKIIMNAEGGSDQAKNMAAISQVWQGFAISTTARLTGYGISDEEGKAAIRNKNDQFPFSLGYSTNGGISLNAGGVNISTGIAGVNGCVQIGNTAATGSANVNGAGQTYVDVNGQKKQCPTSTSSTCRQKCLANGGNDTECNAECPN